MENTRQLAWLAALATKAASVYRGGEKDALGLNEV